MEVVLLYRKCHGIKENGVILNNIIWKPYGGWIKKKKKNRDFSLYRHSTPFGVQQRWRRCLAAPKDERYTVQVIKWRPSPVQLIGTPARSTYAFGSSSLPSAAWGGQKHSSTRQLHETTQLMDAVSSTLWFWIKNILTLPPPKQDLLKA